MIVFNSFKPPTGIVKSVTMYPSELGLKAIEKEQEEGPIDILKQEVPVKANTKPIRNKQNEIIIRQQDDTDIDINRLRKYEQERLKYYYAIIEFDSNETAEYVYDNCNGLEYELSSIPLDLRIVPPG